MKILAIPLPAILAPVALQFEALDSSSAPSWLTAFFVGVWAAVSVLEKMGKLPGQANKDGFGADDRKRVESLHSLLAWKDDDGVPRFLRHAMLTADFARRQEKLDALIADSNRLTGLVTDQLRIMNQRIDALEKRIGKGA